MRKLPKWIQDLRGLSPANFLFLTVAGLINAFGVTIFLAPVKLYDSGISGTSMLLSQLTPETWTLSIFLLLLNTPLFLYGLRRQGAVFTVYAMYTVAVYSLGAWLITDVLPVDVTMASPLAGSDLLLCALFGGLISGLGSGLAIRYGGAMDGIEVMAVIFAKRLGVSVGTFVMAYNIILYIICDVAWSSRAGSSHSTPSSPTWPPSKRWTSSWRAWTGPRGSLSSPSGRRRCAGPFLRPLSTA